MANVRDMGSPAKLGTKSIIVNGIYNASSDNLDGYSQVDVDVPQEATLGTKSITANGTYNASSDSLDGYSQVSVAVPAPVLGTKNITANGTYTAAAENLDGFSAVTVAVPSGAGATITVSYSSAFYDKTMTCTKGGTTYTETTTSAGTTVFTVNDSGTWTITCNGVSRTVDVVLAYSTQMTITQTVTIYSAASDTVSFTDATGAKTVTTNTSGQGSVSITFIPNSTITFTSSYAKNPNNLSQAYSKTITMTDSITSVYVMPTSGTNMLYWYGYIGSDTEFTTSANGWANSAYGKAPEGLTVNTRDLYGTTTDGQWYRGFASKTSRTYSNKTVHFIGTMAGSGQITQYYYPYVGILSTKNGQTTANMPIKALFSDQHKTGTLNGTGYLTACTNAGYVSEITVKALWVE